MTRFAAARSRWVNPFSWTGRRNVGPRAAAFSPVFAMCHEQVHMRDFKNRTYRPTFRARAWDWITTNIVRT